MKVYRTLLWMLLLTALAACGGAPAPEQAVSGSPTFLPPTAATEGAPTQPSTAAMPVTVTVLPTEAITRAAPTATVTPLLASPSPVGPTATPTATLPPTSTPRPSPTLPPTLPPTVAFTPTLPPTATFTPTVRLATNPYELGEPDMLDPMDIPGKHWYVWGNPHVRHRVEPGRLVLIVDKTGEVTYWVRSTYPALTDAYLEGVFLTGPQCNHKDRYGLLVRSPSKYEGILFIVSCDGMFKIFRWNGGLKILQDWTRTPAIHTGARQRNRVGVWMEGTTMRLFINNEEVAQVEDSKFTEGTFGLLIGADATPRFEVAVDQVAYWLLPQPAVEKTP